MPAAERQQETAGRNTGNSSRRVGGQLAGYRAWCPALKGVLTWAGGLL